MSRMMVGHGNRCSCPGLAEPIVFYYKPELAKRHLFITIFSTPEKVFIYHYYLVRVENPREG